MHLLYSILRIVLIDLVLSGDNAVIIGMAAHRLDPKQRRTAILAGGAAAIVLRMLLTAAAALLLRVRGLHLLGGLLLVWIGFKLLGQEQEDGKGVKAAATMKQAIATILVADFIMSLDNVLGVAGASDGNVPLLLFGLILSMAILMFLGSLVADLINRFWWLAYIGSAIIVWTGAGMIFEDRFVHERFALGRIEYLLAAIITLATLAFAYKLHHGEDRGLQG